MSLNPEFQRNLLLEWSLHRMTVIGGTIAALFVLAGVFGTNNIVANIALFVFLLTTVLWGAHRAGDAILDELRERTWDSQKMSAIDPWVMTWGKLFGATVMPWFAGSISLIVYFIEREGPTPIERLQMILFCIVGAILVHSLSLIGALVGTHLDKFGKSTLGTWASVGALALLAIYFANYLRSDDIVMWYGASYDRFDFLTVSAISLCAWMIFGAYRLMCTELAVTTLPLGWVAFLVYLIVYFSGVYLLPSWPMLRTLSLVGAISLMICGGSSYVAAFALYRDPLTFRRLSTYARKRNWRRFFEEVPVWMVSMSVAFVAVVVCIGLHFGPGHSEIFLENLGFSALVIWLLPLRDILILYFFTYGFSKRRVETSTIICLAMLYWLLPSIIESIGLVKTSWLLRPPMEDRPLLSATIICAQVIVVAIFAARRYRQRIAPTSSAS